MPTLIKNIHYIVDNFLECTIVYKCASTGKVKQEQKVIINPKDNDIFDRESGDQLLDATMRKRLLEAVGAYDNSSTKK